MTVSTASSDFQIKTHFLKNEGCNASSPSWRFVQENLTAQGANQNAPFQRGTNSAL